MYPISDHVLHVCFLLIIKICAFLVSVGFQEPQVEVNIDFYFNSFFLMVTLLDHSYFYIFIITDLLLTVHTDHL